MAKTNSDWLNQLKIHECPDSTYFPTSSPLVFEKAKGSLVWDAEGKEYIDLCAGFGALVLGHNPDCLSEIWRDLAEGKQPKIVHGLGDVYPTTDKIELLKCVADLLPKHLSVGALALSGSQAVEIAIKTAMLSTRKSGIISFRGGYHGVDFGTLAVTERFAFREPFLEWITQDLVEFCDYGGTPSSLREQLIEAFQEQEELGCGTAAVIVEPIQGRAGVVVPTAEWLEELRFFCEETSTLLIFDEVFTGLGRLGEFSQAEKIKCDLICLGKALGGGLPLSACFGRPEVMNAWPKSTGEALHTGTFFGHPLACRVGKKTLEEIKSKNLCERSRVVGEKLLGKLKSSLASNGSVKAVRGRGLMIAIEFSQNGRGATVMDQLRAKGVIAIPCGEFGQCLAISPALTIEEPLLEKAVSLIVQVCSSI